MKRFLRGFGIFLAFLAIGIVSALAVVAFLLRQEEVPVPDLTGQDIVTVIETLSQQGLQLKVERREPNQLMPKDTVISQTPAAGNGIKKGRPVRVVISQGPSELLAPNLVGEHYRKADIMIRQAGFLPAGIARVSSESVERDIVIAQAPQPNSPLEKGGMITMLVSSGKRPVSLVVPRLIGKRADDAVQLIERMGLQHQVTYRPAGEKTSTGRTVLGQKPSAGYPVIAEGTIEIIVSK